MRCVLRDGTIRNELERFRLKIGGIREVSLALLSSILGKHGITHKQSLVDRNFVQVYELIDGRSVPVMQVNIVDGSFLEMPHYSSLTDKNKRTLADAKTEYKRRFQAWYQKSR